MKSLLQNYDFRPGLKGSALTLLGVALFLSLMVWQIGRAEQKRQLQAEFEARRALPVLDYAGGALDVSAMRYRKVRLSGHFMRTGQLLLDNVVNEGRPGYEVITPFRLDTGDTLLVDRGWVPQGPSRAVLPDFGVEERAVKIAGWLDRHRSRPVIGGDAAHTGDDLRWLYVDVVEYRKFSGLEVPDFVIHLAPESPYGYQRTQPRYDANVGMHIGYAIQWGVFALIAAGTWLALSFRRRDSGTAP